MVLSCSYSKARLATGLNTDSPQGHLGIPGPESFLLGNDSSFRVLVFMVSKTHSCLVSVLGLVHLDDVALRIRCSELKQYLSFLFQGSVCFISLYSTISLFSLNCGQFSQYRWIYIILVTLQLLYMNKMPFQGYCITLL